MVDNYKRNLHIDNCNRNPQVIEPWENKGIMTDFRLANSHKCEEGIGEHYLILPHLGMLSLVAAKVKVKCHGQIGY